MKKVFMALGILFTFLNSTNAQVAKFLQQSNSDYWGEGPLRLDKGNNLFPRIYSKNLVSLDFNGDKYKDIIMSMDFGPQGNPNIEYLRFFKNNTNGTFTEVTSTIKGPYATNKFLIFTNDFEPQVFDFNNDGMDDFCYAGTMENMETKNYDEAYGLIKGKEYYYNSDLLSFEGQQVNGHNTVTFLYYDSSTFKYGYGLFDKKLFGRFYSSSHADMNNDGFEDLIVDGEGFEIKDNKAVNWFNGITIWKNDNGKSFKYSNLNFLDTVNKYLFATTGIGTENSIVSTGDYNNDGYLDIQIMGFKVSYTPREQFLAPKIDSSMWTTNYRIYDRKNAVPETRIYYSKKGDFDTYNYVVVPNIRATHSFSIDLNNDGKNDMISIWNNAAVPNNSQYYLDTISNKNGINSQYYVAINKGNNTFEDQTSKYFPYDNFKFNRLSVIDLKIIDLDNDGFKDIFPITGAYDSLYSNFIQSSGYAQDTIGSHATIYYKNYNNEYFKKIIIDSFFYVKEWGNYPVLKNLDTMYSKYFINQNPKPKYKGEYILDQLYYLNRFYINDYNNDGKIDLLGFGDYNNDLQNFLRPIYNLKYDNVKIGVGLNLFFACNIEKPLFVNKNFAFCLGDSTNISISNNKTGERIKWYYGNKIDSISTSSKVFKESLTLYVTKTDSLGCYIVSDTIHVTQNVSPSAPIISRDTSNFLVASSNGTSWYKEGIILPDTTQKIKPDSSGLYTARTKQNGCISALSTPYYYLVTDVIKLSANEFIKLAPNPFINQINFDFLVKGYQRLNIEVYDIATGTKVASQLNLTAGSTILLGQLSGGTYIIRVTSNDNKIVQQFKMVKL